MVLLVLRLNKGMNMKTIKILSSVLLFATFGIFSFQVLAKPLDNVKCYEIDSQSIAEICTDHLWGFFEKATFINKDGSRCHLVHISETNPLDVFIEGYHYSLATFAAQDNRTQILRLRYVPVGYEQ